MTNNMAMSYFKAYHDMLDAMEPLTNEERGRLFRALLVYSADGTIIEGMGREYLTFYALKGQIDRDHATYNEISAQNSENGKKGGRPKSDRFTEKQPLLEESEKSDRFLENRTVSKKATVSEKSQDKDKDKDKEEDKYILSGKPDSVGEIIGYLNQVCGTHYKATTPETVRLVRVRLKEGFTVDDFKHVIDTMHAKWGGSADMARYLRPQTLFGTKFESYLNTAVQIVAPVKGFENYTPNTNNNNDLYERATKLLEG